MRRVHDIFLIWVTRRPVPRWTIRGPSLVGHPDAVVRFGSRWIEEVTRACEFIGGLLLHLIVLIAYVFVFEVCLLTFFGGLPASHGERRLACDAILDHPCLFSTNC